MQNVVWTVTIVALADGCVMRALRGFVPVDMLASRLRSKVRREIKVVDHSVYGVVGCSTLRQRRVEDTWQTDIVIRLKL